MAHTKAQKSTKGNRDSIAKRLGVKLYGGEKAKNGNIIIRQRGMTTKPGINVKAGVDFTLYAIKDGIVTFTKKHAKKVVSVIPEVVDKKIKKPITKKKNV